MSRQKVKKCEGIAFENTCDLSTIVGHNSILQSEGINVCSLSLLYTTNALSLTKGMIADEMLRYYEENIKGKCQRQQSQEMIGHWNSLKKSVKNSSKSVLEKIPLKFFLKLMEAFEDVATKIKIIQIFVEVCPDIAENNDGYDKECATSKMPVVDEENFSAPGEGAVPSKSKRHVDEGDTNFSCSSNPRVEPENPSKKLILKKSEHGSGKVDEASTSRQKICAETQSTDEFGGKCCKTMTNDTEGVCQPTKKMEMEKNQFLEELNDGGCEENKSLNQQECGIVKDSMSFENDARVNGARGSRKATKAVKESKVSTQAENELSLIGNMKNRELRDRRRAKSPQPESEASLKSAPIMETKSDDSGNEIEPRGTSGNDDSSKEVLGSIGKEIFSRPNSEEKEDFPRKDVKEPRNQNATAQSLKFTEKEPSSTGKANTRSASNGVFCVSKKATVSKVSTGEKDSSMKEILVSNEPVSNTDMFSETRKIPQERQCKESNKVLLSKEEELTLKGKRAAHVDATERGIRPPEDKNNSWSQFPATVECSQNPCILCKPLVESELTEHKNAISRIKAQLYKTRKRHVQKSIKIRKKFFRLEKENKSLKKRNLELNEMTKHLCKQIYGYVTILQDVEKTGYYDVTNPGL
ncbi:uncharacterized protein LOC114535272 [Dendronephthya gigantea]|uniref:uncharacterized protein LOC114535272 n=1 Tax=Dendronephthya gigantea TaxID=151771 RepID=UPI00106A0145|nr:uncharacterized protein LOC114535272 [Dendronephthya gigantea]